MIALEYLKHAPSEPLSSTDPQSTYLNECSQILQEVVDRIPGMSDAHLLRAKCKYLEGDLYGAESLLLKLKSSDSENWRVHLLQCQVALHGNNNHEAQSCLDTVIGLNFDIQTSLIYHLIKAKLLESNGCSDESIELLETVTNRIYAYIEEKNASSTNKKPLSHRKRFSKYEQNMDEDEFIHLCINAIIALSQLYKSTNQMEKAKNLMKRARAQFKGENEVILIRLSEVRMLLKQGEVDSALSILHGVPLSSSYYVRSRLLIADIYLKHKKSKTMYVECFEQLVGERGDDIHCHLLLADAYMNVQQTGNAIGCYEDALMLSDDDQSIALKLGRALFASHDYQRAILHFESTLANVNDCGIDLKMECAELYIQLKQYEKAKILLTESIASNTETFHDLSANIKMLCLFAKLYQNVSRWEDAETLLSQAWSFQQKMHSMATSSGKDMKPIEMRAAEICYNLGFVYIRLDDTANAEIFLSKAIDYNAEHEEAAIQMAKLCKKSGNWEAAMERLKNVLSINQNNESALILLVHICVNHKDAKSALAELKIFRESNPLNICALIELIKVYKKCGKYDQIKQLMKESEDLLLSASTERMSAFKSISNGMHFLRGFVLWYLENDGVGAINELNQMRNDIKWAQKSLNLMIKIYLFLCPNFTFIDVTSKYLHCSRNDQLEICQSLLKELKVFDESANILSIGCLLLMASNSNKNANESALEKAHKSLKIICKKQPKHLLAHLAFACSLNLKKMPNKAISFLNEFVCANKEQSDDDEYQHLLLILLQLQLNQMMEDADDQSVDKKSEMQIIQKMCLQILKEDASCSKAWEICAIISEKQSNFVQCCKHFETAWNLTNKKNEFLGYSVARMQLKNEQYIECIDTCHRVMDKNREFKPIHVIIDHALNRLKS